MFLKRLSAAVVIVTCFGWAAMGAASESLTTATNTGKENSALAPLAVDFSYSINRPTCNGDSDGSIDITINTPASGTFKVELAVGAGAYTTVIANTTSKSFPIPNLRANTYKVRVTDTSTDPDQWAEITGIQIIDYSILSLTLSQKTDCSCPGTSDGSLKLAASGGDNSSYSYTLNPGGTNTTGSFTNLAGNIYTGIVVDGNGCQRSISNIEIESPNPISSSIPSVIIDSIDYAGDLAKITLNGLPADIADYQILLDGAAAGAVITGTSAVISNVSAGSHTIKIQRIGCIADSWTSAPINIINYSPITFSWSPNPNPNSIIINCFGQDTTLTVTVLGGKAGKTVELVLLENGLPRDLASALPFGVPYRISELKANVEYILLAINDAPEATRYTPFRLTGPTVPFTIDNVTPTNVTCSGQSNGKALVTITGGSSPYKYTLNNSTPNSFSPTLPTNRTITDLAGGSNYNLILLDDKGCISDPYNFSISEPDPISVAVLDNLTEQLSCPNSSTGKIYAKGAGGTKPYYFTLEKGGSVVPPYSSFPVAGDTAVFSNLAEGNYTIRIKDGFCAATETDTETIDPLVVNLGVVYDTIKCNNGTTNIRATATGGDGSVFTYTLIDSKTGITDTKTESVSGSGVLFVDKPASTYRVQANYGSCTPVTKDIFIENPRVLEVIFDEVVNLKCPGDLADVTIFATGNYPYEFSLDGIVYTPFNGTSLGSFTMENLTAGSHSVWVRDKYECVYNNGLPITFDVVEPATILIADLVPKDVLCNSKRNGSLSLTVSGGTPGYTLYLIDNSTSETVKTYPSSTGQNVRIPNIPAGVYSLSIKDKNGCMATNLPTDITINEPDSLQIDTPLYDAIKCFNEVTAVTFSVSGGWPVAKTITILGEGVNTTIASGANKSLKAGTYTLTASDDNGCRATDVLTITQPDKLVLNVTKVDNVSCNGAGDAAITFNVTGGTPDYQYGLGGSGSGSIGFSGSEYTIDDGLSAGTYNLVVKDNNSCQSNIIPVSITEPALIDFTIDTDSVSCSGAEDGRIVLSATGGDRSYRAYLTKAGSAEKLSYYPVINDLTYGTYAVRIEDGNGCTSTSKVVSIGEPELIVINGAEVSKELACFNDQNASITINAVGGRPYSLQYQISGRGYQADNKFNNLPAGDYIVKVRNSIGNCETQYDSKVIIDNPTALVINEADKINVSCFNVQDGTLQINAEGGTGALNYYLVNAPARIQPNPNSNGFFSDLGELNGSYSKYVYKVEDQNGCFKTDSIIITNPPKIEITLLNTEDVRCYGEENGSISVEVIGGTGNYSFQKNVGDAISQNVEVITNSSFKIKGYRGGDYTPVVTDANGCSKILEPAVRIKNPAIVEISSIDWGVIRCTGDMSDVTTVHAKGGTPGYYYSFDNGESFSELNDSTFSGIKAGNKYPRVKDKNGCLSAEGDPYYYSAPDSFVATYEFDTIKCHYVDIIDKDLMYGDMTIEIAGGSPPYTLSINDPTFTTNTYNIDKAPTDTTDVRVSNLNVNLDAGITYKFYLKDNNGCYISNDKKVNDIGDYFADTIFSRPPELILESIEPKSVFCGNEATGSIEFTASGGFAPKGYYDYQLKVVPDKYPELSFTSTPGAKRVENLMAGYYTCMLTDAYGCKANSNINHPYITDNAYISSQNIALFGIVSDLDSISCDRTRDGSLSITVKNFLVDGFFWEAEIWEGDTIQSTRPSTDFREGYFKANPVYMEKHGDTLNTFNLFDQKILKDIGIGIYRITITDSQSNCQVVIDTILYSTLGDSCPPMNYYNAFTQYSGGTEYNNWEFGGTKNMVYNLKIFTSYGDLVYDSDKRLLGEDENVEIAGKYGIRWDGLDNKRRPVPAGTYIYLLRTGVPPNETVRDGNVTILRNNGR